MSVAPVVCSARARRTVLSRTCTSPTPGAPRRRLSTPVPLARPGRGLQLQLHTPRVCSVPTP
eukprot:3721257-Prymnesium_polylepis.1